MEMVLDVLKKPNGLVDMSREELCDILGYRQREFDTEDGARLEKFFSNLDLPVFSTKILGILSGALGSKQSRNPKDVRTTLVEDVLADEESRAAFDELNVPDLVQSFGTGFYQRVFSEFGDDSIAQVVPINVNFEDVTAYQAMHLLHHRLLAGIEKSTRYRKFHKKVEGRYPYFVDPLFKKAGLEKRFVQVMDQLFDSYRRLNSTRTDEGKIVRKTMEMEVLRFDEFSAGVAEALDIAGSEGASQEELSQAYKKTLNSMQLDRARSILPLATKTQLTLLMNAQNVRDLVLDGYSIPTTESVVIAELLRRDSSSSLGPLVKDLDPRSRRTQAFLKYLATTRSVEVEREDDQERKDKPLWSSSEKGYTVEGYRGLGYGKDVLSVSQEGVPFSIDIWSNDELEDLVAAIVKERDPVVSEQGAYRVVRGMNHEEMEGLVLAYAGIDQGVRTNRRHRPGRAFERFSFDINAVLTIGEIRDVRRHRILTLYDSRYFSPDMGFFVPEVFRMAGFSKPLDEIYQHVSDLYGEAAERINPHVASYGLPLGTLGRFPVTVNARELHHICELRTQPGAHLNYKQVCQMIAKGAEKVLPVLGKTMKFVDSSTELDYGRAVGEIRSMRKLKGG